MGYSVTACKLPRNEHGIGHDYCNTETFFLWQPFTPRNLPVRRSTGQVRMMLYPFVRYGICFETETLSHIFQDVTKQASFTVIGCSTISVAQHSAQQIFVLNTIRCSGCLPAEECFATQCRFILAARSNALHTSTPVCPVVWNSTLKLTGTASIVLCWALICAVQCL